MSTTRHLDGRNLAAALDQVQAELASAAAGSAWTWCIPPGTYRLDRPLALGAAGRTLHLQAAGAVLDFSDWNRAGDAAALDLSGRDLSVEGLALRARRKGELIGLRARAEAQVAVRDLKLSGLRGARVTGLDIDAQIAELGAVRLDGLRGSDRVEGLRLRARNRLGVRGLTLRGLYADAVTGVSADAPRGLIERVELRELVAGDGAARGIAVGDPAVRIRAAHLVRTVAGADLGAAITAAQAALVETPAGSEETWELPPGRFELSEPLRLGAAGRVLRLRGAIDDNGRPATRLRFAALGLAGDEVTLDLTGSSVEVERLALRASAAGPLTVLRVRGEEQATARQLILDRAIGDAVTGIDLSAPRAEAVQIEVRGLRARAGDARAVLIRAIDAPGRVLLSGLEIGRLTASGSATGVTAIAGQGLSADALQVRTVSGADATGLRLQVRGAGGELSVLDARVERVEADAGDAIGAMLVSAGDLAVRSLSTRTVQGNRALGVLATVAGGFDWLGGRLEDLRGRMGGAAALRLVAAPSEAALRLADLTVEALRGAQPGNAARPSVSWLRWGSDTLANGEPAPLPVAADADHSEDLVGIMLAVPVLEDPRWIDRDPGAVFIEDSALRRISGTALQVMAELRDCELRGVEVWTALRAAHLEGERLLMVSTTWHRLGSGIGLGPCSLSVFNSLVTGIAQGAGLLPGPESEIVAARAAFVQAAGLPFESAPVPLPFRAPGPEGLPATMAVGALAPDVPVDLRLVDDHGLKALPVVGDPPELPIFVGAHEPEAVPDCELRDPLVIVEPADPSPGVSPPVDYRARDARALRTLMMDRAAQVMPEWTERNPADMTTMLIELMAERLDRIAYQQEQAVAEGWLDTARQRRSVEGHARLVDYRPDPGLSATAMLRFEIDAEGLEALGWDPSERLVIPSDTLVLNPDAAEASLIFATEHDLAFDLGLAALRLVEDVDAGSISALLAGDLTRLEAGRWLLLRSEVPDAPGHVVRLVSVAPGTDTTRVTWDPRRPAPVTYRASDSSVDGNLVPAHHGVPLTPTEAGVDEGLEDDAAELLRPWREALQIALDNRGRRAREIPVPFAPVSVQAAGWPLPGHPPRAGAAGIALSVEGEPWPMVDDLTMIGPGEDGFVLRNGGDGGMVLRVGDGINGSALPRREIEVTLGLRVGLGRIGNVGRGALTRVLVFGTGGDVAGLLPGASDRTELLTQHIGVTNPIPATGGRDPEPLERIRHCAPYTVRRPRSAVVLEDYRERLLELAEVAGASVRLIDAGVRRLVRVTLLLRDEDRLMLPELGAEAEAERLRRWALARHHLEQVRLLGLDVELVPPLFVPLDLDLVIDAEPWASAADLRRGVKQALGGDGGLFDPDSVDLGQDLHLDAVHRSVLAIDGVAALRVRRFRRLMPEAIDFTQAGTLPLATDEVPMLTRPYGEGGDGLLTLEVCGGLP